MFVQTEITPNPNSLKFLPGKKVSNSGPYEINAKDQTNNELVNQTEWFNDAIIGTKHGDFFVKRSINYSKRTQSITGDDLFKI